eukprot:947866-Prorocentrum_minimum.AAC.1
MSASAFERICGRGSSKKWRETCTVPADATGGGADGRGAASMPIGEWLMVEGAKLDRGQVISP